VGCLALAAVWVGTPAARAQTPSPNQGLIVRDQSLGAGRGEIVPPGTDPRGQPAHYLITPELGQRGGRNLFHSFERFGVGAGETATFTGPDPVAGAQSIDHVLARVTGPRASAIDGTLRSTIPGADVWLANPNGVMLGPGARLDVGGSFHVTSADEIRFPDGEPVFVATPPAGAELLATSAPEAFGFLRASPAAISLDGSVLEVPRGERIALVGGALRIAGGDAGFVSAPGGDVALVSVAGPGRVSGFAAGVAQPALEGFAALGGIEILDDVILSSSGLGPGDVAFRGDVIELRTLLARRLAGLAVVATPAPGDVVLSVLASGGRLVLRATPRTESAGRILVRGGDLLLVDSELRAVNLGPGPGAIDVELAGGLEIHREASPSNVGLLARTGVVVRAAGALVDTEGNLIEVPEFSLLIGGSGPGGDIDVVAANLAMTGGALIAATSLGSGAGGSVSVRSPGRVELSGRDAGGARGPTAIFSNAQGSGDAGNLTIEAGLLRLADGGAVIAQTTGNGDAGDISVAVRRLEIEQDSQIDSSTSAQSLAEGDPGPTTGLGGDLVIVAREAIRLSGRPRPGNFGQLSTGSQPRSAGAAGSILVQTPDLEITDGAGISVTTRGPGAGGDIRIRAGDVTLRRDASISARSEGTGAAGRIGVEVSDRLRLDGSRISSDAENAFGGSIAINAESLRVEGPGRLAVVKGAGQPKGFLVHLRDSEITTSVQAGAGDGGNVVIDPVFLVLDGSRITAFARGQGDGGNILIVADFVIADGPLEEVLDASSQSGVAGTIEISAPDVDLAGTLATLPASFLSAADSLRERCASRGAGSGPGSFVVTGRSRLPRGPDEGLSASAVADSAPALAPSPGTEGMQLVSRAGELRACRRGPP
jgi:filamentous hemagglutinin family protein